MTTMISEVYDAFRDAQGVTEEKARKAAEAVAAYGRRFADVDPKLAEVRGDLRVMRWMLATIVAGVAALLVKAFA